MNLHYLHFLLLISSFLSDASITAPKGNLLVIDLGTDSYKTSLILPDRKPFYHVVLNAQSKRKTLCRIGFESNWEVSLVGEDANPIRAPQQVFASFQQFIGREYSDHKLNTIDKQGLRHIHLVPNSFRPQTVMFSTSDGKNSTTPEEMIALLITSTKQMAERHFFSSIADSSSRFTLKDVLISIPPYYTHTQRQLLSDAVALAGMNLVDTIDDISAVSLAYGIDRYDSSEEEPRTVVFIDMGASSTRVSVVTFSSKLVGSKRVGSEKIIASAWDHTIAGFEFDLRIVKYLLDRIKEKDHSIASSITTNAKSIEKLFREAKRTKEILSANKEVTASIEGLIGDFDFQHTITRSIFETLISEIEIRLRSLIEKVLTESKKQIVDIHEIEIVGGTSRVPRLQQIITEIFKMDPGMHLNGDEGALLGASYYGTIVSSYTGVERVFDYKPTSLIPLEFRIISVDGVTSSTTPIFIQGGENAFIAFKTTSDHIKLKLSHPNDNSLLLPKISSEVEYHTINNLHKVITEKSLPSEVLVTCQLQRLGGSSGLSLQWGISDNVPDSIITTNQLYTLREELLPTLSLTNLDVEKKDVNSDVYMQAPEKIYSQNRLQQWEHNKLTKGQLEEAKSNLESLTYEMHQNLDSHSEYFTTPEKDAIRIALEKAQEVIDENSNNKQSYVTAKTELKNAAASATKRIASYKDFDVAVEEATSLIQDVKAKVKSFPKDKKVQKESEFKQVINQVTELESWVSSAQKEQQQLPKNQDPKYSSDKVHEETNKLKSKFIALMKDAQQTKHKSDDETIKYKVLAFVGIGVLLLFGYPIVMNYFKGEDLRGGRRLGGSSKKKK